MFVPMLLAGSEPFDEGFDRHIWALSDQSLNLDGEIAQYRREEPDRLLKVMQEVLDKQKAVDEKEAELLVPDDHIDEEMEEGTKVIRLALRRSSFAVFKIICPSTRVRRQ